MTDELMVVEEISLSTRGSLPGLKARYETLVEATKQLLKKDVDFGVIPGTNTKPVLLKPGAEKLTTLFCLRPAFTVEDKMEDWTAGRFYYRYRCTLYNVDGNPVGDGEGSCNTLEKKYRWRNQQRTCPTCGQATIVKGRNEYGGGWLCWKKKGGCGIKFKDGDQQIEGQSVGQIENPEPYDLINTVQKMAQKRALVAAVLVVTGASAFFTQDLDDFDFGDRESGKAPQNRPNPRQQQSSPSGSPPPRVVRDSRPYAPAALRAKISQSVSTRAAEGFRFPPGKIADFQGVTRANLEICFAGDKHSTNKRKLVANYLVGEPSSKHWDDAQTKALHRWLNAKPDDGGLWMPDAMAVKEAQAVAREAAKEVGQQDMFEPPAPLTHDELVGQWGALKERAHELGIDKFAAVKPGAGDDEIASAIDALAPLVAAAEGKGV